MVVQMYSGSASQADIILQQKGRTQLSALRSASEEAKETVYQHTAFLEIRPRGI